ncbi:MAG: type II toxin-antitoxin system RelE/ParE family toxin [Deltaproteobacteria bacterium]|jgi:plasmid stabilization system protein ParE|nr:type II toxin-antitoxin system RelE/ParE family toxin [Deltaproteobacteria bacterium]
MTPTYKVQWAEVAEKDLIGIIEYIAENSLTNAINVFEKLKKKALSLNQFPQRGRIVPELKDHGIILYRELIVTPWRIIYRISGKKVYVLSVIDSRQNFEDILLNRLIE